METEVPKKNKEPSKRAAAQKKQLSTLSETLDDEDEIEIIEDGDFEPISKQSQVLGQKLITEVLKLAENSPDKKVRKMRASPFNKKSSSFIGREITIEMEETSPETENSLSSLNVSVAHNAQAVVPRARPQRAKRQQQTYVISDDSESDAVDDSEIDQYSDLIDDED